MPDNVTNCAQIRKQMLDAIADSLSVGMRAGFDAHLGGCNSCRDEFHRVQTLLQAIDCTLSVNRAAEPSAQLVANVRQSIAARPRGAAAWRRWRTWATAAGVCAAVALLFVVARTSRNFNRQSHNSVAVQTSPPSSSKPAANAHSNTAIEAGTTPQLKPRIAAVNRALRRTPRDNDYAEPEIVVQPGQMQAILRFAAAMQRGQIDGAQFLADQKTISEPLEITPLAVAPLKIEPLDANAASPPPTASGGFEKTFVSGHSD